MQERTLNVPSEMSRVTVGENRTNTFVLSGSNAPATHSLFTRDTSGGYLLDVLQGMGGSMTVGGNTIDVSTKAGQSLSVSQGDWGTLHYHGVSVFFQFVDGDAKRFHRKLFAGMAAAGTLTTALWFSFVVQFMFVFVCRILWDQELEAREYELPDRLVRVIAAEPPDEIMDTQPEEEEVIDESTSARAGGEEGRFGEEDAEIEDSILPDHDGPMLDELPDTELGRAMEAAIAQSGELSNIFGSNDLMAGIGADFATAGEGDMFVLGRGSGGMGLQGTGRGGGGSGFGRVHGVGNIDTGGGRGVSANMGRRGQRAPRARVERGRANVSGFLSREQIERVVRRHSRGIRYCYERELQDDPALEGRIVANWTIDLDGHVSRRSIENNSMGNRNVESCLLREVGRMRFPEPDGGMVVVSYPFTFRGVTE